MAVITGSGTGSSGYRPLADYYHYCRAVILVTADELGLDGPGILDSLGLYIAEADSDVWIYDSVRIWVQMTTATSVPSTWDVSGATLVFQSDSLFLEQNLGWYNFDITDFNYDGTSNLLIFFQNGNQHTLYSSKGPDWRYTPTSTSNYYGYNTSDSNWGTSLTLSTYRPDLRLKFENVPMIVDRVEIENGEVRADNDVLIGGVGLTTFGGASIIGYDNTSSGLAATSVQAAIDEIAGTFGSPENYIQNQTTTPQSGGFWVGEKGYFGDVPSFVDTAWSESFESITDSLTPPAGWGVDTVSGSNPVVCFDPATSHPSGYSPPAGTVLVRFNSYSVSSGGSARLKQTSGTDMSALGWSGAAVSFELLRDTGYSSADDRVVVQYSTDGGSTWNDLDTLHRYSPDSTYWENEIVLLPVGVLSATDLRIAFLFISGYGNDVYLDNVHLVEVSHTATVRIEGSAGEIAAAHYRDSSGDLLLRSSDGSVTITEDADGSYDLTVAGGGSGCVTLDGAYNCGGAGAGATINASAGPVVIDASGASNGALNVLASNPSNAALYINHTGGGNGIWNEANYWSPHGNVALGSGFFHTDSGWFQSNGDFVVKIDANDDGNNMFKVENSAGNVMFEVDEFGNVGIAQDLLLATGGINDGVGTGAAGQVLTADGSGHLHWQYPSPDSDWVKSGNLLYNMGKRADTLLVGTSEKFDNYALFQIDSGGVYIRADGVGDLSAPALMVTNLNGSSTVSPLIGSDTWGIFASASSDTASNVYGTMGIAVSGTTAVGVYGQAVWGQKNIGVYGYVEYDTANWAGYFDGGIKVIGAVEYSCTTVAANTNYIVQAEDHTILVNTGSDGTNTVITLPNPRPWKGRILVIKKIDSGSDGIDLIGTVDGATDPTGVITSQYQAITLQSDGLNWWIIGQVGF